MSLHNYSQYCINIIYMVSYKLLIKRQSHSHSHSQSIVIIVIDSNNIGG